MDPLGSPGRARARSRATFQVARPGLARIVRGERADLDAPQARSRNPRGHLDGLLAIARLDEVVAAELLLRLGEGTVDRRRRPAPDAHRGGGGHRLERRGAHVVPALAQALTERQVLGYERVPLALG